MIVADVGNSRMKWGRCDDRQVVDAVALPLDDPAAWEACWKRFVGPEPLIWVVAGVNPDRIAQLVEWLNSRATKISILDSYQRLPIALAVDHPERVGIDRLLNALAAKSRDRAGRPAALVDAGSAVTVDWLDAEGVFRGGAIFPGLRLMARALHDYTARLPAVEVVSPVPNPPAPATEPAIAAGIHGAVVGGIAYLVRRMAAALRADPVVYLTGGDASLLAPALDVPFELWPNMTLEGIRLTARNAP